MDDDYVEQHVLPKPVDLPRRPRIEKQGVKIKNSQPGKRLDGPWLRHPNEIRRFRKNDSDDQLAFDINVKDYRILWQEVEKRKISGLRQAAVSGDTVEAIGVFCIPPLADMNCLSGMSDQEVERAVERHFVHHEL